MNVDVSPDGRRIVFDLLGDLYTMPIGGSGASAAERITSGPAFDMQPRFSPDGNADRLLRRTATACGTSGRSDVDGKDARQVSKEKRWFVNSPTWGADGNYIFARRHFVKERSLGAGEIWMFHANGSEGLQVTERNGFQKDAGEPAVSADGRYLYYSKDVTPGQTFEYNKDPNGLIYAIVQRDLATGHERRIVSIQGGSITPRPSPDGKLLAYIRRVRLQSKLYVRDLESGRDRVVFEHLDKDLQETWAVHGVYPQYAWMPDGKALSSGARARSGAPNWTAQRRASIPFTAKVEQTINDALRFPQKVYTPRVRRCKMLRDVRDVAGREAGRLRRARADLRPSAACGRAQAGDRRRGDSRSIRRGRPTANRSSTRRGRDAGYGRVRVMKPDGTGGRDVVTKPGHYIEPSFSPDGKMIVFRNAGADAVRGSLYGVDPGNYVVPADGSAPPRLVLESGTQPMFDHTGKRIYLFDRRDEQVRAVQRRTWRSTPPGCRRATRSSTSSPRTRCRSCRRRMASGSRSKSGSTPTLRRFRIPDVRSNLDPA